VTNAATCTRWARRLLAAALLAVITASAWSTADVVAAGSCASFVRDGAVVNELTAATAGGPATGGHTSSSCLRFPTGSRQGPDRWLTVHTTIAVDPSPVTATNDIEATVELRVDGWDAVQSAIVRGPGGDLSASTATVAGLDDVIATPQADGTFVYEVTNYVAAASVHDGDVPISLTVDGAGIRSAIARSTTLRWVDVPPSPVVSAIDRTAWPVGSSAMNHEIELPVVVSTQRADLTDADVIVEVRVGGTPVDVRPIDAPQIDAGGHVRRTTIAVTPRTAGSSDVTVTVRVPSLGFDHDETLQLEARRGSTSSASWVYVAAGIVVGMLSLVIAARSGAAARRRLRRNAGATP
jgi:hypothetical protein